MDIVSAATRSRMMSSIRSRNTKPEIIVRSLLHRKGFRFRLNVKDMPGKPDIILPRHRKVILVHGCYWHGHQCSIARLPTSSLDYWLPKIQRTRERDEAAVRQLSEMGWKCLVIWECQTRRDTTLLETLMINFMNT